MLGWGFLRGPPGGAFPSDNYCTDRVIEHSTSPREFRRMRSVHEALCGRHFDVVTPREDAEASTPNASASPLIRKRVAAPFVGCIGVRSPQPQSVKVCRSDRSQRGSPRNLLRPGTERLSVAPRADIPGRSRDSGAVHLLEGSAVGEVADGFVEMLDLLQPGLVHDLDSHPVAG